ncbi:MAG: glycosyltransferase family 9 protein [Opitutales bacterium]
MSLASPAKLSAAPSIAIFRRSALGDVVLAAGAVAAIARALPAARLTWFIAPAFRPALTGLPGVEFVDLPAVRGPASWWRVGQTIRVQGRFDVLLAMQASTRSHILYPFFRTKRRIGLPATRGKEGHRWFITESIAANPQPHLADEFGGFARALGVAPCAEDWAWPPKADEAARAWLREQTGGRPFVVVHLATSKPERDWPVARYAVLLQRLQKARPDVVPVLTGGASEREKGLAVTLLLAVPGALSVVGRTSFAQLFALCECAVAIVSPDSAPVHIGAAYGTPVVGLYAVSRAAATGPFRQTAFTVDVYAEAMQFLKGKASENTGWHERVHHPEAMRLITVDAVWEKLRAAMEADGGAEIRHRQ